MIFNEKIDVFLKMSKVYAIFNEILGFFDENWLNRMKIYMFIYPGLKF